MYAYRIAFGLIIFAAIGGTPAPHAEYTYSMFKRAMAKDNPSVSGEISASPLYVLVDIVDPTTNKPTTVCLWSSRLRAAINAEYHLDGSYKGDRKQFRIAIASHRRFRFQSAEAQKGVEPLYPAAVLQTVRIALASKTRDELCKEIADPESQLTRLYDREGIDADAFRDATAHVLLERGILVGAAHEGPLYPDKGECSSARTKGR